MPPGREAEIVHGDAIDIAAVWRHMGHPVAHDDAGRAWVLGTAAGERADALRSLMAPDFTLPGPRRPPAHPVGPAGEEGPAGDVGLVVRLPQ